MDKHSCIYMFLYIRKIFAACVENDHFNSFGVFHLVYEFAQTLMN